MIPDSNEGALAFFPLAVAQFLSSAKEDARAAYVASAARAVHARP